MKEVCIYDKFTSCRFKRKDIGTWIYRDKLPIVEENIRYLINEYRVADIVYTARKQMSMYTDIYEVNVESKVLFEFVGEGWYCSHTGDTVTYESMLNYLEAYEGIYPVNKHEHYIKYTHYLPRRITVSWLLQHLNQFESIVFLRDNGSIQQYTEMQVVRDNIYDLLNLGIHVVYKLKGLPNITEAVIVC